MDAVVRFTNQSQGKDRIFRRVFNLLLNCPPRLVFTYRTFDTSGQSANSISLNVNFLRLLTLFCLYFFVTGQLSMHVHCLHTYYETTRKGRTLWRNLKVWKAAWAQDVNVSLRLPVAVRWDGGFTWCLKHVRLGGGGDLFLNQDPEVVLWGP